MSKIIGIDLGTTNSVVAVMQGANRWSFPPRRGADDAVCRRHHQRWRAPGRTSSQAASVTNPENTVYSIKRFMADATMKCKKR